MLLATNNGCIAEAITGDCRESLRKLPDASIQCCVTSPPYWGLRDYGTAKWEGGDPACAHIGSTARLKPPGTAKQASDQGTVAVRSGDCACGARRVDAQLGLESTPEEYTRNMVEVFREVRRVLRDDGTLWLNLGDSYASSTKGSGGPSDKQLRNAGSRYETTRRLEHGLKEKDLVGIPWRVAFALQADGWYLRQDIIWRKPNPMPESVRDRCTKAHEYIFLLSKSAKYHFDSDAIHEDGPTYVRKASGYKDFDKTHTGANQKGGLADRDTVTTGRNKRSVWTVTTKPFKGAHFATFPPDLIEPCVLAGSRPGDTVLDPFGGSGTTAGVALRHGRNVLACELNPEYVALMTERINHVRNSPMDTRKARSPRERESGQNTAGLPDGRTG